MLFFCVSFAQAQNFLVGVGIGQTSYTGDLDGPGALDFIGTGQTAFELNVSYIISPHLNLRLNGLFGALRGDDADSGRDFQLSRNLDFETSLNEYALLVEYSFFDIVSSNAKRRFTPYVHAGVGVFTFNPKASYIDPVDGLTRTVELQPLGTEGQGIQGYGQRYNLTQLSIPFGGGVKYALNKNLTIGFGITGRFTFTDYIDDVSGVYPNTEDLLLNGNTGLIASYLSNQSDEAAGLPQNDPSTDRSGLARGESDVNDYYFSGMIGVYYRLTGGSGGGGIGCPTF